MPRGLVFAIGSSAGGVEALQGILREIPSDFPATILIVQHTPENGLGTLADLLARRANIPVVSASDRLVIKQGMAFVAPPGRHMIANDGRLTLESGPSVNRHRPAIDPLFRSAAEAFGRCCVGIVLTGYLDDGAAGAIAIREAGGKVIIQDPEDAVAPSMPLSALQYVSPDFCVPLGEIPARMVDLAQQGAQCEETGHKGKSMSHKAKKSEPRPAAHGSQDLSLTPTLESAGSHNGKVSVFVCPECSGTLWEADNHNLLQFKCRVGHTFSAETMYAQQSETMETTLWKAIRALEEHADLSLRLAERARKGGHTLAQGRFEQRFKTATQEGSALRELLTRSGLMNGQDAHADG